MELTEDGKLLGRTEELLKILNLKEKQCYSLSVQKIIPKPKKAVWDILGCAAGYILFLQGNGGETRRDYTAERTRLTRAQADKVELDIKTIKGELLTATAVEATWSSMTSAARQRLLALPYRLATAAVAAESFEDIQQAATDLISEALNELHTFNPTDYQQSPASSSDETGLDVEAPAETNRKRVGRPKSPLKQRSQRGTRPMAN